jgi:hypothetical protein
VALGRNVFMSSDPRGMATRIAERVHARDEFSDPFTLLRHRVSVGP